MTHKSLSFNIHHHMNGMNETHGGKLMARKSNSKTSHFPLRFFYQKWYVFQEWKYLHVTNHLEFFLWKIVKESEEWKPQFWYRRGANLNDACTSVLHIMQCMFLFSFNKKKKIKSKFNVHNSRIIITLFTYPLMVY